MLPDIYYFNPTCEPAIANGSPYYTAPALLRKFESDLGYLPGWLGTEDDQVIVKGEPDPAFADWMNVLGFRLPRSLNLEKALSDREWLSVPKGRFRPWGWSPSVYQLFRNTLPSFTDDFQHSAVAKWLPEHKNLYSRLTAIGLLEKIARNGSNNWLPFQDELPVVCHSHDQIYNTLGKLEKGVVKSPWSSSGRGLLLFPNVDTKKKNDELLSGMLNQQGFVTVEPWLDKVLDLSYQFTSRAGKICYMGRSIFETDKKGRYIRNFLTDNADMQQDVRAFLEEYNQVVVDWLADGLFQSQYATLYEGWIGVDAMIYRSADGRLKFHPFVEINGRYTMGAVAMKLKENLAPGSGGFMQLFYSKSGNFLSYCQKQQAAMPLVMENQKIISGFMPLTPPLPDYHFGAYIEVQVTPAPRCF